MGAPIDDLIRRMVARGWRPDPPAGRLQIAAVERHFGIRWPDDYREFLGFSNGGGRAPPDAFRGLMRLEEIVLFNESYRVQDNFPGLVAFANEGFLVYAFDFRQADTVISSVGLSSSDWSDVIEEAASFVEWLEAGLRK